MREYSRFWETAPGDFVRSGPPPEGDSRFRRAPIRLREAFPDGFALDAEHRPHITLLQCFVAVNDLESLCDAAGDVIRNANVTSMELQAVRYSYTPGPGMGIAGIWAALTPEFSKLQADVVAATTPFMMATATIGAFTAGHANPSFDAALIDYVSGFVANGVGASFEPHVSTGIAAIDYLDRMLAEPFLPFAFAPASAAVYQLGPFGTAARLLKRWDAVG
jgi:hypothetical protein